MIYAFKPENDEYIHLVSGLIREELGKTLNRLRKENKLTVRDVAQIYGINPASLHSLENNTRRNPWTVINKTAAKYGYDLTIRLKFSVDVMAKKRPASAKEKPAPCLSCLKSPHSSRHAFEGTLVPED